MHLSSALFLLAASSLLAQQTAGVEGNLTDPSGAAIPAILITADRSPPVREAARAYGIVVLNKPVKPATLRALLSQWRSQQTATSLSPTEAGENPQTETEVQADGSF